MSVRDVESVPLYPVSPSGVPRREHLPTVDASIRYWEAVRRRALREGDVRLERTASGLRESYEAIRHELIMVHRTPTLNARTAERLTLDLS